ncbi:MAG: hypothetical protein JST80_12350 [Bdellovibrionales bacterium]|nr:hypothetical protein [Bdellovibrionales bacterium]
MDKSLFLILGLLSSVERAESAAEMTLPESAMPADMVSETVVDPELDANNNDFYEGRFVLELNTRINGSVNGNLSNRSPVYFGIQTGYLFVKDNSNTEFAVNIGAQL